MGISKEFKEFLPMKKFFLDRLREGSRSGKVLKVIDGDTIWVKMSMMDEDLRLKLRLGRVNTPEISCCLGKEIKDYLTEVLLDKVVYWEIVDIGKYGRPIADVKVPTKLFSDVDSSAFPEFCKSVEEYDPAVVEYRDCVPCVDLATLLLDIPCFGAKEI